MSLSSRCHCSWFINVLIKNGYDSTLTTLLHDLNLDEYPCDVRDIMELLCGRITKMNNNIINHIRVENAITICDELCAPHVVNAIIKHEIMLDKLSEHQIINHNIVQDYISIYNRGYRIIIGDECVKYDKEHSSSFIYNAYNNGLYSSALKYITNDNIAQIMPHILNDVRKIYGTPLTKIASCKNVKTITNLCCDGTEPLSFAKNIKYVSISHFNDHCVNLEQFTQLNELRICNEGPIHRMQFPPTIKLLYAYNCDVCDWTIEMCTRLKKLLAYNNPNITTCAPFASHLVVLYADGLCGINDDGLQMCQRLKVLVASSNPKITTCKPFAKTLRLLLADHDCRFNDDELRTYHRLEILYRD